MIHIGEALEQLKKVLEIEPNFWLTHWVMAGAYERKGQWPEAITACQRAQALDESPIILGVLGLCYAGSGRRNEAQRVLDELQQLSTQRFVTPYYIAMIYAALGESDQAFVWLEKAYAERDENIPLLKVDLRLDSLRTDSRFADLQRRVGLAP